MSYLDLVLVKINEMTLKVLYQKFANSYIKIEQMYIVKQKLFCFLCTFLKFSSKDRVVCTF